MGLKLCLNSRVLFILLICVKYMIHLLDFISAPYSVQIASCRHSLPPCGGYKVLLIGIYSLVFALLPEVQSVKVYLCKSFDLDYKRDFMGPNISGYTL